MIDTKISWAHATWNPWTGCDKVSNECVGCYADALLTRTGRTFNILALTQTWKTPYQLNALAKAQGRQAICFVCSLSDFFHADADRWRRDAWRIIHDCKNVNFMLLTKRPERIAACLPGDWNDGKNYPNAWLGTTCGARSSYARLDVLRSIPCALRFVSVEPLMESVSDIDITGIGWVAVGGMSGALHAKHKMKMVWAAEVHDVCRLHEVPFLFKQASDIHTERGINALSLYLAERAGILSLDEIRAILGNIQPAAIKIMVATAAASALRRSEFRGLKWEDLDLNNLWFHCRRGLVGKSETKMKTRASRKRVEMNPALAEALLEWRSLTLPAQNVSLSELLKWRKGNANEEWEAGQVHA
jgi:protein gp37